MHCPKEEKESATDGMSHGEELKVHASRRPGRKQSQASQSKDRGRTGGDGAALQDALKVDERRKEPSASSKDNEIANAVEEEVDHDGPPLSNARGEERSDGRVRAKSREFHSSCD